MSNTRVRGVVDTDLFNYGPEASRLLVRAWRMLARGRAITETQVDELIAGLGVHVEGAKQFLQSVTERDAGGDIVGVLGLSLNDHPHHFNISGLRLATWCAIDTLFLPAMLGQPATVEAKSPLSGRAIRLTVGPDGVQ